MNTLLISVYIAAMVTANLLVWWLGPWWSPINAFLLIGLDLTLRDILHERLTAWMLAGVIVCGAVITWLLNPGAAHIAVASAVAFGLAAAGDWFVYSLMRAQPWLARANGSNVVGAAIDSAVFPTLAFGVVLPQIIALQFAAKILGGAVWSFLFMRFAR